MQVVLKNLPQDESGVYSLAPYRLTRQRRQSNSFMLISHRAGNLKCHTIPEKKPDIVYKDNISKNSIK